MAAAVAAQRVRIRSPEVGEGGLDRVPDRGAFVFGSVHIHGFQQQPESSQHNNPP